MKALPNEWYAKNIALSRSFPECVCEYRSECKFFTECVCVCEFVHAYAKEKHTMENTLDWFLLLCFYRVHANEDRDRYMTISVYGVEILRVEVCFRQRCDQRWQQIIIVIS